MRKSLRNSLRGVVCRPVNNREMFKFGGLIDAFDGLPNDIATDPGIETLAEQINDLRKWVEDYFDSRAWEE